MALPAQLRFIDGLESLLLHAWGTTDRVLQGQLLSKTRKKISKIRNAYRYHGDTTPRKLRFSVNGNRAGYLGAFAERHAYLAYHQLQLIDDARQIPQPRQGGELTVTVVGAAAAVEVYGLTLWFNEKAQRIKRLRLNLIEKVPEWAPTRQAFLGFMGQAFPKVRVYPRDIGCDLSKDAITVLAQYHDVLIDSDMLIIYNTLNEIPWKKGAMVWRNLRYILTQVMKPLLILIAEPSAYQARPHIEWLRNLLVRQARVLRDAEQEEFVFDDAPTLIMLERDGNGLNRRLFGKSKSGSNPALQDRLKRNHLICVVDPTAPLTKEDAEMQFAELAQRHSGKFRAKKQKAEITPLLDGWATAVR